MRAAESFIIMGSWCSEDTAWLLSGRAVKEVELRKIRRKADGPAVYSFSFHGLNWIISTGEVVF